MLNGVHKERIVSLRGDGRQFAKKYQMRYDGGWSKGLWILLSDRSAP